MLYFPFLPKTDENIALKSLVEHYEQRKTASDETIHTLENRLIDSEKALSVLNNKFKKISHMLISSKEKENELTTFCSKLFEIYKIPQDMVLAESLNLFYAKEEERTRVFKTYKSLLAEKQELIKQNMQAHEELGTMSQKIKHIKNMVDDKQLVIINKEQENLKLSKKIDKLKHAKNVIYESRHYHQQALSKLYLMSASLSRISQLYNLKTNEFNDLQSCYVDIKVQHDLLLSLNSDLSQKTLFMVNNFQMEFDQLFTKFKVLQVNLDQCKTKLAERENQQRQFTRSASYFNKRNESIISVIYEMRKDLKKELKEMRNIHSNDEEIRRLQRENSSLKDDVEILTSEIGQKNKLVDILMKKDFVVDNEKTENKSFLDKLLPIKIIDEDLHISNQNLKQSLEESLHKNIILKVRIPFI
ncbi:hypothetical protein RF11_12840 [Thelohanellus kitauei]|uniref:Uncharacterized protein n=1 Tax=Thelohanellus kitauei TaxID=669202 RepID=A0A0C2M2W8_THEKT|nr:hypothetical protein RF11_12840 [Thelohanellus kitauei]